MLKKQSRIVALIGIAALSSLTMLALLWRFPLTTCVITLATVGAAFLVARAARPIETDELLATANDVADRDLRDRKPRPRPT
jgi:membrane protein implicated in regulation of membrane protease activity